LFFKNQNALDSVLNGRTISSESDFRKVAQSIKNSKTIKSFSNIFVWPFSAFTPVRDKIYTMNPGEITAPFVTRKGYFIVLLTKKEEVKQQPFKMTKEQIETELKSVKTEQIVDESQNNIFEKALIEINEPEVSRLSEYLQANKTEVPVSMADHSLMSYTIDRQRKFYTVSQYWDYIHHLPLVLYDFSKKEVITATLKDEVIRQYMLHIADSLGILRENKYLLDKKNFRNELILSQYFQKEFRNKDSVSNDEILSYYEQNKASYTGGKVSLVSFLYFNDYNSALNNRDIVYRIVSNGKFFEFTDTTAIKGLVSYQPNIKVEKDNLEYPPELKNDFFSIPEGEISMPKEYKNSFILFFVTRREGVRVKEVNEVRAEIEATLRKKKEEQAKNNRLQELYKTYNIEKNKTEELK
jgi:peptidyl-prolyl cis-trans isomerase C